MFCPNRGTQAVRSAKFCYSCGSELPKGSAAPSASEYFPGPFRVYALFLFPSIAVLGIRGYQMFSAPGEFHAVTEIVTIFAAIFFLIAGILLAEKAAAGLYMVWVSFAFSFLLVVASLMAILPDLMCGGQLVGAIWVTKHRDLPVG